MSNYAQLLDDELPRVMHEVIVGLLGENDRSTVVPDPSDKLLSCRVAIGGGFHAEVVVSATLTLASRIAQQMFEGEQSAAQTERDARDALCEVANIVAGNLKPLFGDNNQLGLPEDLAEPPADTRTGQLARAIVELATGRLDVRVYTQL